VKGAVPPLAVQAPLYAAPTIAFGRLHERVGVAGGEVVVTVEVTLGDPPPPQLIAPNAIAIKRTELQA